MDRMADTSETRFHDYAPPGYHTVTPFIAVPAGRGAEIPSMGVLAPDGKTVHGSFAMYVPDPDAVHAAAVAAGARDVAPVEDVFSGDRMGVVMCPFGHRWVILKRVEDVPEDEIERRAREWVARNT
jgi:PhnB protein